MTRSLKNPKVINRARVLVAILQAMQNVFPDTYIRPRNKDDSDCKEILNINMVKTGENIPNGYFENAQDVTEGCLLARILVKSNNPLSE
jgi:hypothetical protein